MASKVLKLRWLFVIAAALSLVTAVACGSSDEKESTTAATDTTAAAEPAPAAKVETKAEETEPAAKQEEETKTEEKEDSLGYVPWTAPTTLYDQIHGVAQVRRHGKKGPAMRDVPRAQRVSVG